MTGFLLCDKPAGPTSHDVVATVRRALGRGVKVGHAGTLDPFATGLLVLAHGGATRLLRYLVGLDKRYVAEVRLGVRSSTGDSEGEIVASGVAPPPTERLHAACAALTGELAQVPPATSAIKVDGVRAYALARRGEEPELAPRQVVVHAFEVAEHDADVATLSIHCGSGTYVRALVRDLGDALGCGAYCTGLRRTAVGELTVALAGSPDEVAADPGGRWALAPAVALGHLPRRSLTPDEAAGVRHGRALEAADETGPTVLVAGGELVAVAVPQDGRLRPQVVLGAAG